MPLLVRQDDMLLRIIKDLNDIRSALRRVVGNIPLFDISNENTPAQITSDQNNYVPGNFDVLRLSTDAPRTITGLRGGVKGRFLRIFNIGTYEITLSHQSLLSLAGNRIFSATGFDIVINAGGQIVLYYDLSRAQWIASYASNTDRISCRLRLSADVEISDSINTTITWETEVLDTGDFWDPGLPTIITIPETGWYAVNIQTAWSDGFVDPYFYIISSALVDQAGYFICSDSRMPFDTSAYALLINIGRSIYLSRGDQIHAVVFAATDGTSAHLKATRNWFGGTAYTEFNIVKQ